MSHPRYLQSPSHLHPTFDRPYSSATLALQGPTQATSSLSRSQEPPNVAPLFSGSKALSTGLAGVKLGGKSTMFGQGERNCCSPTDPQGTAVIFNIACCCLFHFLFRVTLR